MAYLHRIVGVCCIVLTLTNALPAEESRGHSRNAVNSKSDLMDSIYNDCLKKDSVSCVKYKLFSFVDKMLEQRDSISLTEGVTVVKTPGAEKEGAPRKLSGEESMESLILGRIQKFLQTHTIKVDLKGTDVLNMVSSTGRMIEDASESILSRNDGIESRGKKKKKGFGIILLLAAAKAAALIPLALGAIALIAGKALLVGKIALVLSAIIGLKKLLSQEKHVTYEVVAHPSHTSSSSHSSSHDFGGYSDAGSGGGYGGGSGGSSGHGWARSAMDQAYKGQKP